MGNTANATAKLFDINDVRAMELNHGLIRKQLMEHIEKTGISQAKVAKSIGIKSATLSLFLHDKYPANADEIAAKVMEFLHLASQRLSAPKKPEFVVTTVSQQIMDLADYVRVNNDIGLIDGDAGVGKTRTLEEYAARHRQTIIITAGEHLSTKKELIEKITKELKLDVYGTTSRMTEEVIQTLKGSEHLIIVDEATELNERAKKLLRTIHDLAEVGVVYCGTHELYQQFHSKNGKIFPQLLSRIGIRRSLNRADITKADIKLLFEQSGQLDNDCLELLHQQAKGAGGIRYAKKVYMLAATLAFGDGQPINLNYLQEALKMVMVR